VGGIKAPICIIVLMYTSQILFPWKENGTVTYKKDIKIDVYENVDRNIFSLIFVHSTLESMQNV